MNKKTSSAIAFNSGDYVVYPAHGVGKVADISKQKIAGSELELIVVNFAKDKMTLRIPMAKAENVGLRKISEASTMNDALNVLKGKAKVKKIMWSRRAQEYENKINSGNPVAIAEVVRDLYRKKIWPNNLTANVKSMSRRLTAWPTKLPFATILLRKRLLKSCFPSSQNNLYKG